MASIETTPEFQAYLAFFDAFCRELNDRHTFPAKWFGSIGPKCGLAGAAANACLQPAFPLVDAIMLRSTLKPTPAAGDIAAQQQLLQKLQAAVTPANQRLRQPIRTRAMNLYADRPACQFLYGSSRAILQFTMQNVGSLPIRLAHLVTNTPKMGALGILDHITRANRLLGSFCPDRALQKEIDEVIKPVEAEVVMEEMGRLPRVPTQIPTVRNKGGARHRHTKTRLTRRRKTRRHH